MTHQTGQNNFNKRYHAQGPSQTSKPFYPRCHSFRSENPNTIYNESIYEKLETIKYQVNTFPQFVKHELIPYLMKNVALFQAGQIYKFYKEWGKFTSDPENLEMVQGTKSIFSGKCPVQHQSPPNSLPHAEAGKIDKAIQALQTKGVIIPCFPDLTEFISFIFTTPKKDGNIRLILNHKRLNESVENYHLKMDNIHTALKLITKNCWLASLDLKDAYYSVPIHGESENFLKFSYNGKLFQFTAFANGLCSCPRKFTKLLKPVLATLRVKGHLIIVYIDNLLLIGQSYNQCVATIIEALTLLEKLGFVNHPLKSVFIPTQEIVFLGFLINSHSMTIRLTVEKKTKLISLIASILSTQKIK